MNSRRCSIENYIRAKDENRPDLLRHAFDVNATAALTINTKNISFPGVLYGLPDISETLVRRFNQTYENIYTFCIGDAPLKRATSHTSRWLVGMSAKDSKEVRIGCGLYEWSFDSESGHVTYLHIRIDRMQTGPVYELEPLMDWLRTLDYPWCEGRSLASQAPRLSALEDILPYLASS
ncbi:hypothetical protein [Pseudomonas oryzihabitans]|uniref:hypothetical protein n=1 Tax=Pseudomonas oryzihabitans TaxID=47885 RepID=UPI00214EC65A|nr:hypothetical protein [Pseudomonas psychrotolerans]UUW72787.1 hypothetical protein NRG74_05080 [Pseudomonas psychrotolerans]